uniref:Ig-like domain-containing protein n=1 Tax=Pavo cristatus TaxID=9049 RepID=A0A8C9EVX8_PAVCR
MLSLPVEIKITPPQIVSEAPAHIHCCEGEAVVLECVVSGQPPPAVTWSQNGQNLSASERLSFDECEAGTHRLHIRGVSVSDAGLYCCVAKNVAGTAQSASELTVGRAIYFLIQVTAGDPAILEYTVTGTPELKTKWFKDGKPLPASKKYRISFKNNVAQLKFYAAEMQDSGEYTFEISNDVGISSCTTNNDFLPQNAGCLSYSWQLFPFNAI